MLKVVDYKLVIYHMVKECIDEGWQPWGSAISHWEGTRDKPHQPMVRYEEGDE